MGDSTERNIEILAIGNIMRNRDMRDFMWKQLERSGVFENTFNNDPIRHSYNAGLRQSGLLLERELKEAAPGDYLKMIKENING